MNTKRLSALLLSLVLVTALLAACGGAASSAAPVSSAAPAPASTAPASQPASEAAATVDGTGRTLVVGIWGSTQEEIVRELLIPEFEAATGATVELITGGSSDRYALIYAEEDAPSMDVVYLNQAQTEQASADGVIQPANPAGVPEYANLYEKAKASGGYGVAFMSVGLMYSTDEFAEAPTSWEVCWDEQYKGRVAPFVFPGTQGTAFLVMAAKINGGDENNIDPGFEAIAALKPLPAVLSGIDETNLAFEQGDVVLAPQIDGYVYAYQDEGGSVGFTIPEEGGVLSMNCAAIPTNSANADLAEVWINLHLSQDVQQAYAERLFYGPTNSTIQLSGDVAERVVYGDEDVDKLISLDNAAITANQAEWTERWNQEILG